MLINYAGTVCVDDDEIANAAGMSMPQIKSWFVNVKGVPSDYVAYVAEQFVMLATLKKAPAIADMHFNSRPIHIKAGDGKFHLYHPQVVALASFGTDNKGIQQWFRQEFGFDRTQAISAAVQFAAAFEERQRITRDEPVEVDPGELPVAIPISVMEWN